MKKNVSIDINIEIEKLDGSFIVKGPFNVTSKGLTEKEAILNFKEEFELHIEELHFINK